MTSKRTLLLALSALLLALSALSQTAPSPWPGDSVYARPGQLVSVGTHRLNLYCMGSGSPAVIFDSGWEDWAPAWSKVQPEVAKFTRACSYDRAGAGFSEPGPMPRTSVRIAQELRTALHRAGVRGPYILVGIAFGGDNVRTFADLYPNEVAGLVLMDADADDLVPPARQEDEHRGEVGIISQLRDCRNLIAEHKPLPDLAPRPGQPHRTCAHQFFRGLPEAQWSPELNAKLMEIAETKVAMYDAYISEMEQVPADEAWLQQHRRSLGSRPIRVITSGNHGVGHLERKPPDTPEHLKYEEDNTLAQATWLALSSNSEQIFLRNSSEYSSFDEPETVIATIREVYAQHGGGRAMSQQLAPGQGFRECAECPEMKIIPPGQFTMGSSDEEKHWAASHGATMGAVSDEAPQHAVTLPSFALGKYDVTRGEYAAFVRATKRPEANVCGHGLGKWDKEPKFSWQSPGFAQTDRDPVVCVSWDDAQAYVAWLSKKSGHEYRLPSESEWEYAARAGTTTKFWWGDNDADAGTYAWFRDNSGGDKVKAANPLRLYEFPGATHPVGLKPANAFGLHDIVGNVWQWTEDCYDNDYAGAPTDGHAKETPSSDPKANDGQGRCLRVDRGGSWMFPAWLLRPATRERNPQDFGDPIMGFRVARTLPLAAPRAQVPDPGTQFHDCSTGCPEMVMLPQGSFIMGAPPGEEERENAPAYFRGHAIPQHSVTIRYSFALAKFDVTRDEYAQFVAETTRPDPESCYGPDGSGKESDIKGANWHAPGYPQTGRDPVVCVNWDDAHAYVAWLSGKTGHVYRLPTEAEWEYAARAGTMTARYGGDKATELCRYINHGDLDFGEQHPHETDVNRECRDGYAFTSAVGSFPPNRFGLYDMLGNVWQWTEDCWNDDYTGAPSDGSSWQNGNCGRRVMRGGAYSNIPALVRSAVRLGAKSPGRDHSGGFRVARTLP